MKLCFLDLETTGVEHQQHGIIQIAGQIEINDQIVDQFDLLVKPFKGQMISPKALEVNGRTKEEIETFADPPVIYQELVKILSRHVDKFDKTDKLHFIGYNSTFDMNFLREFFSRNGDKYFGSWFYFPDIDVMRLAAYRLMNRRAEFQNFKLTTVAKALGLRFSEEDAHDGMFDITLTRALYKLLIEQSTIPTPA